MKQLSLATIIVTVMSASLLAVAKPAAAHHLPNSYCSDSGDVCQSTRKVDGVRRARIHLAARYFGRYVLCVRSPLRYDSCLTFRIEERSGGFGDGVRLARHFNISRAGEYAVAWYRVPSQGPPRDLIGRRLGFHVR